MLLFFSVRTVSCLLKDHKSKAQLQLRLISYIQRNVEMCQQQKIFHSLPILIFMACHTDGFLVTDVGSV